MDTLNNVYTVKNSDTQSRYSLKATSQSSKVSLTRRSLEAAKLKKLAVENRVKYLAAEEDKYRIKIE